MLSNQVAQLKEARVHADYDYQPTNLAEIPEPDWETYADKYVALASQLLPAVRRLTRY